jgi:hypothetical protein
LLEPIVLLEEIPEALVSSHLHDAELIRVPEISEDGLYIGFVHAQN